MLLMRQKRVVIFLASEGRSFAFRHMGKEQSSRCRTGAWGLLALSAIEYSRLYQFAG